MNRHFQIPLTILLLVTNVIGGPVYAAVDHCRGLFDIDGEGCVLHVHGPEHGPVDRHAECGAEACDVPEMFDATGYGAPHHHDVCAYSVTDHRFNRTRADGMEIFPCALAPLASQFHLETPSLAPESRANTPSQAPCLLRPAMRGPPVC